MIRRISTHTTAFRNWLSQSNLLYEDEYLILALISGLDVVAAYFNLLLGGHLFGNTIDLLIKDTGIYPILMGKLLLFTMVVLGCEALGRRNSQTGRRVLRIVNVLAFLNLMVMYFEMLRLYL